jgi:hypothetical protein
VSASLVMSFRSPSQRAFVAVLAKRAYRMRAGERAEPLRDEVAIVRELCGPGRPGHEIESDLVAPMRSTTDVILVGHAHAPDRTEQLETSLVVGELRKRVRVHGDRVVRLVAGEIAFSAPVPFVAMPLTWERAYGGEDTLGASGRATSYPRNAAGKGFFLDLERERLVGAQVPNLDDPDDPVAPERLLASDALDWLDRPVAASYGAIDVVSFPRACFLMPPAYRAPRRPVREVTVGALRALDLKRQPFAPDSLLYGVADARAYCAASSGLGRKRLRGGEPVELRHLHPSRAHLAFDLPADSPRLFVEHAGRERELVAQLQTVVLEPDHDRVTLTWSGLLPLPPGERLELDAPDPTERMRHRVVWAQSPRG